MGTTARRTVYRTKRWQKLSKQVRQEEPHCRMCGRPTEEADHIIPLSEDGPPFERSNVQGLCHTCHVKKTNGDVRRNGHGKSNGDKEAAT